MNLHIGNHENLIDEIINLLSGNHENLVDKIMNLHIGNHETWFKDSDITLW